MDKRKKVFISISLVLVGLLLFSSGPALAGGNSSQGKPPLEKARQALEQRLADLPGFAGIAHSEAAGEIIVFLENEQAKGKVPDRFEGFPVRTEVTGRFQALPTQVAEPIVPSQANTVSEERRGEVSPLVGGISLSAYIEGKDYAGTLGMVTYDNKILSNAHVIAMDPATANFLPLGTATIQPGSYDGGTLANQVATLEQYIPINFKGRAPNYADAAIATLDVEGSSGWQFGEEGNYQVSGTTTVVAGDIVRKSGRTTGVTTNEVYVTNASVWVSYTQTKRAYFVDQIAVFQPFIQSGDSGSLVDKGGSFVGLAFAGSNSYAIVSKASYIIDGLGISVASPEPAVNVALSTDQAEYVIETETAVLTAVVSDENGAAIGGLGSTAFTTKLGEDDVEVTFTETDTAGTYHGELSIASLEVGEYTVEITVTDGDISGSGTASFNIVSAPEEPAPGTAYLTIGMSTEDRTAGRNTFTKAVATVTVLDANGDPIVGATVSGSWSGLTSDTDSVLADDSGVAMIESDQVKNGDGTFTFTVESVTKDGVTYNLQGETSGSISI